jgi:Cu-Zn family superoxide dismutase
MSARLSALLCLATAAAVVGCASSAANEPHATATRVPTTGNTASGTVHFVTAGSRVQVKGEVRGLKPNAEHGFHVHEKGDCSSGDGMSTGGHFNPTNSPHGAHGRGTHHAGDLPSLRANAAGVATFSFESSSIAGGSGANDVIGKGLIVHRDPDDYTTQPTGNAGARVACAMIQRS